jgi:hypothetical protein
MRKGKGSNPYHYLGLMDPDPGGSKTCGSADRIPNTEASIAIFIYFFGGLQCVGHSFAYVAHFVFLRDVWIQSQRAASRRATNLDIHLLKKITDITTKNHPPPINLQGIQNFGSAIHSP